MGPLRSNLLNGHHKNIARQQMQPVKVGNKKNRAMHVCMFMHFCRLAHKKMMDFITRLLAGLLHLLIFLRASLRTGPCIRGSQRGRRVISKLKRSGSKGVRGRRISVTSRYNVAHNWLGCCPDCVFISLASHTRGVFQRRGLMIYMCLVQPPAAAGDEDFISPPAGDLSAPEACQGM